MQEKVYVPEKYTVSAVVLLECVVSTSSVSTFGLF